MRLLKLQIVRWISFVLNWFYKLSGSDKVFFYPLDPAFTENPYPVYKKLRKSTPFFKSPLGFWVCSSYNDVQAILKNPQFGHLYSEKTIQRHGKDALQEPSIHMLSLWTALSNPPDHTRLRKVMNSAFSPRVVKKMDDDVELIAARLLDEMASKDSVDILQDFAKPLPVQVICRILGIPESDYHWFTYEAQLPARLVDPTPMSRSERDHINACVVELNEYFETFIELKKAQPCDDLGSNMVQAYIDGQWSKEELIANLQVLFAGGHDTTMNAIASGCYTLLKNPGQLALLKAQPELIKSCVEEIFRYESSFQLASRTALEDTELLGKELKRGDVIVMTLGGANRDPAVFNNPEQFDISREPNKHLAFGAGIHFCIGAMLSRVEAQVAIKLLFEKHPEMQLKPMQKPYWRNMATLRGLRALPVSLNKS